MNDQWQPGGGGTAHEDLTPVWDAVCRSHPLLIEHITGPTRHAAIGLEQIIRAFHTHAVELHLPIHPDMLVAMFGDWPDGAFADRAGTSTFAKDVAALFQQCVVEMRERRDPFFVPQDHVLPTVKRVLYRASDWQDRDAPDMAWIVPDWIPRQQVTGLYAIGGSLKTWWLLQLLMARAVGVPFMGHLLERGPTLGIFCEDTTGEIVRRMAKIAEFYQLLLADFSDFHWVSLAGVEETELVLFDGQQMTKTELLRWLDYYILSRRIGLTGLDTLAHMFGGDEVRRREVARFLRVLDAISIVRDCAVVFTAQPSVRGKKEGTLDSGSTHWEAGVRSRLTWTDPAEAAADGETADPNFVRRVVTRVKSNYAAAGEKMELVWWNKLGFTPAAVDPETAKTRQTGPVREAACDAKFLALLARVRASGDYVNKSDNHAAHYAPAVFSTRSDRGDFSRPEFVRSMNRMLVDGHLRLQPRQRDKRSVELIEAKP
jgi:hypothetical protein